MTGTAAAMLALNRLTAGYDGAPVVRGVDLHISAGEIVALLGANGAGKTTTLRAVSGLVRPMSGTVLIAGEDVARRSVTARARAGLAHVPQDRGLFPGLTVAEHLRLGPRGEHPDTALAYDLFPALGPLHARRAGLLSGGEQQMLALARALARRPSLLLLDELSLGLAPAVAARILPVIRGYATQNSCAVLLVEQHVGLALDVADRGYLLTHGTITAQAPAQLLRADPALAQAGYFGAA
jgi:ABC-type branched-subunit amino acid transport system ATPase component